MQKSFKGSNLVEFKVLPVSLIPGATVGGSEVIQQLVTQTKMALQSQIWKILLILYLVKQHLWGVGHPSWLSRTMLDQTSRRKIMSQIHRQRQRLNLSARAGARRAPRRRRARITKLTSLSAGQGRTEPHLPQALSYLSWRLLFHNSQLFLRGVLHFPSNNKYLWFGFHCCLLSVIQAHQIWGRF